MGPRALRTGWGERVPPSPKGQDLPLFAVLGLTYGV